MHDNQLSLGHLLQASLYWTARGQVSYVNSLRRTCAMHKECNKEEAIKKRSDKPARPSRYRYSRLSLCYYCPRSTGSCLLDHMRRQHFRLYSVDKRRKTRAIERCRAGGLRSRSLGRPPLRPGWKRRPGRSSNVNLHVVLSVGVVGVSFAWLEAAVTELVVAGVRLWCVGRHVAGWP
jgi:hypothetical protein